MSFIFPLNKHEFNILACVASISVKQIAKNGVFGVLPARKMGREQKIGWRGWGRGAKETLADKPLDFENLVIGWASQTLVTCVDQRSSAGKSVRSLFSKSVNFSHGMSIY